MIILLLFAFISGLVTILAPCIWPILPIVLSATATGGRKKPLGITVGIIFSFALFTLTISYVIKIIPFDPNLLRLFAVLMITFLGLTLIIPRFTIFFEGLVSRLTSSLLPKNQNVKSEGFVSGFVTGFFLGIVWSPCAGPILATIATLAATRAVSFEIILVTMVYVIGVGIPLFLFTLAGQAFFTKSKFVSANLGHIQKIFGIIMIITALAIYTNYDKVVQTKLLDIFPSYSQFLYKLEGNEKVKKQLETLKNKPVDNLFSGLPKAAEFAGIHKWLNLPSEKSELKLSDLRGKVVLVDFWTYTCINCIRTLPYVTSWHEKYKDQGFTVIGIHTPEFEFEKKTENVESAIKQYKITYPVAQDNDYATWHAYNNMYWPAKYLIDRDGNIRYTHFGEGQYEETEKKIVELLKEAGKKVDEKNMIQLGDQAPQGEQTPETYLGNARREEGRVEFKGDWKLNEEYAQAGKKSSLTIKFIAKKVFLVITPQRAGDKIKVYLDGKEQDEIILDNPRLYPIVNLPQKGEHILKLEFTDPGIKLFAFTFG